MEETSHPLHTVQLSIFLDSLYSDLHLIPMRLRGLSPSIRSGATLACAGALAIASPAAAQQARTLPVFENGEAQVVPGFSDKTQWIQQSLWVESGFDSDGDGKPDRIHVDVTRPKQ